MNRKIKIDPVLRVAWILAILSAVWVHPDREYATYIDYRSLGILWSLMVIIQGWKENYIFERIAKGMLSYVTKSWQLVIVPVALCFVAGMFVTNDVALITFVPFAILVLSNCEKEEMLVPVVVLQTIAANLGSMLTPIGNPQNLYLYSFTGYSLGKYMAIMAPYTIVSAVMLAISAWMLPGRGDTMMVGPHFLKQEESGNHSHILIYAILFILAFATVLRVLPWYGLVGIVFLVVAVIDRKILLRADYVLLLTFVGFFIFTGNIARISQVQQFLEMVIEGRTFWISILLSQFISNVPATLMLSGFADNYKDLMTGVNVGGLGTLIASMASLISYKALVNEYPNKRGQYLLIFTGASLVFLLAMILVYLMF